MLILVVRFEFHMLYVCTKWVQALTDELVDDGHRGNGWVFTHPL